MITVHDENATRKDLHEVVLQRPNKAGNRWRGIQHGELVDTLVSEVESRGWNVLDQRYSLAGDGADLAGALWLDVPEVETPKGQTLSLGLMTSNRMTKALRLYVGSEVAICHNGLATGDMVLRRMHTTRLDLRDELRRALDGYVVQARRIGQLEERMRARQLADGEWAEVLVEAGRRQLMSWSHLGQVDAEYREPRHEEHGRGSSWTGLQAFTEIVKKSPPTLQLDRMNGFRQLLPIEGRMIVAA